MTDNLTLKINDETVTFSLHKSDFLGEIGLFFEKESQESQLLVRIAPKIKQLIIWNLFDGFKIVEDEERIKNETV